jgi:hypothetical protein
MFGKYEFAKECVFVVLDRTQPCARCKRPTLALFDGKKICSNCAGVWQPAERAAMLEAIRRPLGHVSCSAIRYASSAVTTRLL